MTKSSSKYRDDRSAVAARFITVGASVLDLGCGMMLIRKHLPAGVKYVGYDRNLETPDTLPIDLDAREFPAGRWDYVLLLGVLPWIQERSWTLSSARRCAQFLIVTRKDARFDGLIEAEGWILKDRLPHVDTVELCLYR